MRAWASALATCAAAMCVAAVASQHDTKVEDRPVVVSLLQPPPQVPPLQGPPPMSPPQPPPKSQTPPPRPPPQSSPPQTPPACWSQPPPHSPPQPISRLSAQPPPHSPLSQPHLSPQPPSQSPAQPTDSGKACSCSSHYQIRRWLDCSGRNRKTISPEDLCPGLTTVVNLSNNRFTALPTNWSTDIVGVNISRNLLTAIPRAPPLNPRTHTLDVSFNRIANSSDELRPLAHLQTLVVRGNRLQSLAFLPSPCSLSILLADRNELRSLEGPLKDCSVLRHLDVSKNQLGPLPRDAFEGLGNIQRLKMAHAGITSVAPGAFDDLRYLRLFDLSENKLTTLPPRAFSQKYLEILLLDKNNISYLPADVFSGLRDVQLISLYKNKLDNIPQGLFSGLDKLKYLVLNGNNLRYLPNGLFAGLTNLERLGLQSNLLESLPPQIFSGLISLKRIRLGVNKLTWLPGDLLVGLSSLDLLDLGYNELTSLPAGLLRGVKSIEQLDLSFNRLSTLNGSQLDGLDQVVVLDLKGNQLSALPVYDASWPQVARINLDRNNITALGEAAVRGWLGDGSRVRRVMLGNRQWLRSLESLRWAVDEKDVGAAVDAADCKCGSLTRGMASISFCAAVSCPSDVVDWVVAARATSKQLAKG